jgi:hypothetical protein
LDEREMEVFSSEAGAELWRAYRMVAELENFATNASPNPPSITPVSRALRSRGGVTAALHRTSGTETLDRVLRR